MAYCTVTDVQKLIKSITFGTTTKVTAAEITNDHIPAADAIMDSHLRQCYSVPITNATDLVLLKWISALLTAGIVAHILYETSTQPNENTPAKAMENRAMALLAQIKENEISLVTSRSEIAYSRVEKLYEEQDQGEREPIVTLDKEF